MSTTERPRFVSADVRAEIADFLALDSELLDDRRFWDWGTLLTEDFRYQVPTPRTPDTPFKPHWDDRVMFIDESKWSLETQWFRRLDEDIYEMSWGENPPVRFRHVVSNIRAEQTDDPNRYRVRSNVVLIATRQSDPPKYLSGQRTDTIDRVDGRLYLSHRWVVLDQVLLDYPQMRIVL
ncbi:aromatic-ring-hydroxylating dioxygenase subunit beta [Nocardia sp. R6R-6]|uniref:aromatic-ring-hydroxylating dioxygenase subunit beta n=1 Tax=Nocardia sp. R6R-6 TaxID=3459303 RepID=UPI00403E05AE